MLVLTRRSNQSIVIGHDIVVTVLEVKGDQVRLGIEAPRDVQVHREEVWIALTEANKSALLGADAPAPPRPALPSQRDARPVARPAPVPSSRPVPAPGVRPASRPA